MPVSTHFHTQKLVAYEHDIVSQLTSAICAVMSGSVTSAMGGFFKLRKSFMTLDGIMDIESRYLQQRAASRRSSLIQVAPSNHDEPLRSATSPDASHDEKVLLNDPALGDQFDPKLDRTSTAGSFQLPTRVESKLLDIDPASVGITSHTDIFIHSGTRLCYGILLVVFSMIENPVFNRILYSKCFPMKIRTASDTR